jgi:ribosomal protein L29
MDYLNVTTDEIRGVEAKDLTASEKEVRKQLAELRMDVYSASALNSGKARKLKRTLARILTVKREKQSQAS